MSRLGVKGSHPADRSAARSHNLNTTMQLPQSQSGTKTPISDDSKSKYGVWDTINDGLLGMKTRHTKCAGSEPARGDREMKVFR